MMLKVRTFIVFVFAIIFIVGCQKEPAKTSQSILYVPLSQQSFNLNNLDHLNKLAIILAQEHGEIKLTENTQMVELTDKQGSFKAILARYKSGESTIKLVVPIEKDTKNKFSKNITPYVASNCVMKCISAWPCNDCTLEILDRCRMIRCTCASASEGCSPSITDSGDGE